MNTQKICEKIMTTILQNGFSYQVPKHEVEKAIMYVRDCVDERTIVRWLRALEIREYLLVDNAQVYSVNVEKIPCHVIEAVKNKPQTRLT